MKTLETSSLDQILVELRKISDLLKKMEHTECDIMTDFYRDSFDFMVCQNIETFKLLRSLTEKNSRIIKKVA